MIFALLNVFSFQIIFAPVQIHYHIAVVYRLFLSLINFTLLSILNCFHARFFHFDSLHARNEIIESFQNLPSLSWPVVKLKLG